MLERNDADGFGEITSRNEPTFLGFGWGGRGMVQMDLGSNKTTDTTQHTGVSNWGIFSKMLPDRHFSSRLRCFRYRFLVAEIALFFSF